MSNPLLLRLRYRRNVRQQYDNLWLCATLSFTAIISAALLILASVLDSETGILMLCFAPFWFGFLAIGINMLLLPVGNAVFVTYLCCLEIQRGDFDLILISPLHGKQIINGLFGYARHQIHSWFLASSMMFLPPILFFLFIFVIAFFLADLATMLINFLILLFLVISAVIWISLLRLGIVLGICLSLVFKRITPAATGSATVMIIYLFILGMSLLFAMQSGWEIIIVWAFGHVTIINVAIYNLLEYAEIRLRPL